MSTTQHHGGEAPPVLGEPVGEVVFLTRRRARAPRGVLLQRAIDLRDQLPAGQRRGDLPRWHSWVQIAVGFLCLATGGAMLAWAEPLWNWLGPGAIGIGPAIVALGAVELARRGNDAERRVTLMFRFIRVGGLVMNAIMVAFEAFTALAAMGLLVAAVACGEWSPTVAYLLALALVVALMGCGLMMMVGVTEIPAVALTTTSCLRELAIFRQVTSIAMPVALVGASVALSLRDTRAVALAMVGLTAVLVGWVRAERMATDEAVRRLAVAADMLAQAVRPAVGSPRSELGSHLDPGHRCVIIGALDGLDLACYRHLRRGHLRASPRHLVDLELLAVIRACKVVLTAQPLEHVSSPLTATVVRGLRPMEPEDLVHELLIFAADVRRLATLAPDRLDKV